MLPISDVPSLLEKLGLQEIEDKGDEVYALCPAHRYRMGYEQETAHWSINKNTGMFFCFSCEYKGSMAKLIMGIKHCSFDEAKAIVISHGISLDVDFDLNLNEEPEPEEDVPLSALFGAFVDPPARVLKQRRLARSQVDLFGVRWDPEIDAWVLPIRRFDGELLGWQYKSGSYMSNVPKKVRKSTTLFGSHLWRSYEHDITVLVESPLDAVRLGTVGFSAVAAYGAQVSMSQMRLLTENVERVVLALDNDETGLAVMDRLVQDWLTRSDLAVVRYDALLEGPKDVGEMSRDEIERALSYPISGWEWLRDRDLHAEAAKDRTRSLSLPARRRRQDVRQAKAPSRYGNGAGKDALHYRRRRAAHSSR